MTLSSVSQRICKWFHSFVWLFCTVNGNLVKIVMFFSIKNELAKKKQKLEKSLQRTKTIFIISLFIITNEIKFLFRIFVKKIHAYWIKWRTRHWFNGNANFWILLPLEFLPLSSKLDQNNHSIVHCLLPSFDHHSLPTKRRHCAKISEISVALFRYQTYTKIQVEIAYVWIVVWSFFSLKRHRDRVCVLIFLFSENFHRFPTATVFDRFTNRAWSGKV